MKTYKEIAKNVLRRRDEYYERKADKKAKRPIISAVIAASVMTVIILSSTIFGSIMKNTTSSESKLPELSDHLNDETISESGLETKTVGDITEKVSDTEEYLTTYFTDTESDEITEENITSETSSEQQNEGYVRPIDYIPETNAPVAVDMSMLNMDVMYGYEIKDVMSYIIQYNYWRYGDLHGDHLKVMIMHTPGIELLIPEILTLDYLESPLQFELKFRYTDGVTKGSFKIFFIEDLYTDISEYESIDELESLEYDEDFRMISQKLECCAIRAKGYDFFKAHCFATSRLYYAVALHFGDVDENGVPLYKSNPYLPDYYDCDQCIEMRNQAQDTQTTSIVFDNSYENTRTNNITISGYVKWTDSEGCLEPARNLIVRLTDLNNTSINLSTLTSNTGYYQIVYTVNDTFFHHLNLRFEIAGLNIVFSDPDINFYKEEDFYMSGGQSQTHSKTFAPNNNNVNETYLNKAVSIHQACELIQRYYYQLTGTYTDELCIRVSDGYDIDFGVEARYYKELNNNYSFFISFLDAFDWDKIEYEYAHFIEDNYNMYSTNDWYSPYLNLSEFPIGKENGLKYAYQDGWAMFFVVNAQRVLNVSSMGIYGVGDTAFTNIGAISNHDINFGIENFVDYLPNNPDTVNKCEANVLTIAALLYDFCDPASTNDYDLMYYNNTSIWNIMATNQCKTLSSFIQKFYLSSFSTQEKLKTGKSLEWYNLSSKNITIPNISLGYHTVYWTNPNTNSYNRVKIYNSSYTELFNSGILNYQTSYTINSNDWTNNISGAGTIYVVVEWYGAIYPVTGPYYSNKYVFSV